MSVNLMRLHATTWWGIAIFAAALATLSTSAWFLALLCLASLLCMKIFRDNSLRSQSIGFYLILASAILLIRFIFRIVFNQPDLYQATALDLPVVKIAGLINLFGPVSFVSLQGALVEGLRLAAIVLSIGMANTVANPRKLLRSTPGVLYEIATAAAVAINLAPQLIESMHRVRKARSLRSETKGFKAFRSIVIPVLEDALDRSLALAASMDARGFGRQELNTKSKSSRALLLISLVLLTAGSFAFLTSSQSFYAALAIATGVITLLAALKLQSAKKLRSYYRPERPTWFDLTVGLVSCSTLAVMSFL